MRKPHPMILRSLIIALVLLSTLGVFAMGWVVGTTVNGVDAAPIACFEYTPGVPYPLHPIPCP